MTPTPDVHPLLVESDIVTCRQAVRRLTQALRFSLVDQTRMITAASELARNTLVYGGGGEMRWHVVQRDARAGLRLEFEDRGPGIADLDLALTDGWTSGGGMGLGLSGSKRLVHEFAIRSLVGEGTCVTITRWA
ncbi:MAG: anti-sigma regulatory factor [Betaproteobacteria bacterium]